MNKPTAQPLERMPDDVRASAWSNRPTGSYVAPVVCWIEEKLYLACALLAWASWWIVFYWLLALLFPIEALVARMPTAVRASLILFSAFFLLTVITHWIGVQTELPRKDRRYPALGQPATVEVFKSLALPLLSLSALLALSCAIHTHGAVRGTEFLPAAGASFLLGSASLWLYRRPFTYGYRIPSDNEVELDSVRRHAEFQRSLQPLTPAAEGLSQEADVYPTPIHAVQPKVNFASIFGMAALKEKLLAPAQAVLASRTPSARAPANGMLLHGAPGNGKTVFAEALAGELGVRFLQMTYGDVASKWVGEMPRVISNCFALAARTAPCVFFIDEIDSFITSRDLPSNNSEDSRVTNTMLTEIARLRDAKVVLVAATNHLARLDAASIREGRFDFKIEVTAPDEPARLGLLRAALADHDPGLSILEEDLISVARRWNGFSVARLQAVARTVAGTAHRQRMTVVRFDNWMAALKEVQGRAGKLPPGTKSLADLVLAPATREALELVASRLTHVTRTENLGGTLPGGVLFHGASGTGKTAAAMAVAKECGWAFMAVAGADLSADRRRLDMAFEEAADARPAILFIDEADDLLRNRKFSATSELTNKLLVLMDGAHEKASDVVVIAATNHPETIEPALLRAGRFTEKVQFAPPATDAVPRHVADWIKKRGVALQPGFDSFEIAELLEGQTIAGIEGTLQYAINRAIHRQPGSGGITLGVDDIRAAAAVVLAGG